MRILHVLDHSIPLHSGYSFRTLSILKHQRARGWETYHLTGAKQGSKLRKDEMINDWHFFRTPAAGTLAARLPVLNQLSTMHGLEKRLCEVIPLVMPDVIHAHSPVLNAIPALKAGWKFGIPVVYEIRAFWEDAAVDQGTNREGGARYRLTRALENYAIRHVDAVTTICEGLRADLVKRGVSPGKITVIPNAVDIENFSIGGYRDPVLAQQLHLDDKVLLGFIGSFYAYEGLALLLRALPRLVQTNPKIHVLLVGGGPQEAELKSLARGLGLEGCVTFTGRVPHEQVQRYYDLIDILVYPRLSMRLTDLVTPLKPLEAMAQGKLLLASDVGGHQEIISDGKTGVLFEAGNLDSLTTKILDLLHSPERWNDMREAARRFVETDRNWGNSVSRYQSVYGNLAGMAGR